MPMPTSGALPVGLGPSHGGEACSAIVSCSWIGATSLTRGHSVLTSWTQTRVESTSRGVRSRRRTMASASGAPWSRFMPLSSHSTDSGPCVADVVQRAEDALEGHAAAPRRDEVPAAAVVAEGQVRGQDAVAPVQHADRFLDVHVVDAVARTRRRRRPDPPSASRGGWGRS